MRCPAYRYPEVQGNRASGRPGRPWWEFQ